MHHPAPWRKGVRAACNSSGRGAYDALSGWSRIHSIVPEAVIPFENGLALDFGTTGLYWYQYLNNWTRLNSQNPGGMICVDLDGDGSEKLAVSFAGAGLWACDPPSSWSMIHSLTPEALVPTRLSN